MTSTLLRREMLSILLLAVARTATAQDASPRAGSGSVGTLFNPEAAGKSRAPTIAGDADSAIQAIEQKLACHCGCTLDIFTCRTTDFTCTVSPRLHREVMALRAEGGSADDIIDAFVANYGEEALMAPRAEGFNLAGYLLPSALIVFVGSVLAMVIGRRHRVVVAQANLSPGVASEPDAAQLERLEQALSAVED